MPFNQKVLTVHAAAAAKSLQSCPTLCDPIDGSPPGSPVPGILQARTLEWVAISFSNEWKWKVKVKSLSCVRLLATPWTAAYQAPPSWDFPGKSTGVGCHCLLRLLCILTFNLMFLLHEMFKVHRTQTHWRVGKMELVGAEEHLHIVQVLFPEYCQPSWPYWWVGVWSEELQVRVLAKPLHIWARTVPERGACELIAVARLSPLHFLCLPVAA